MATVTGLTAERMQEIIDSTIVDADIIDNHLILTKDNGGTIDAGELPAAEGGGIDKVTAFPTDPAPEDGDMIVRIDLPGDPVFKFTDGAWELQPRMGALTVPKATVTRSANTASIGGSGSTHVVSWDVEEVDTNGIFDIATPTRLTVKTPGDYVISVNLSFTSLPALNGDVHVRKNGSEILGYSTFGQNEATIPPLVIEERFVAGDYIELVFLNNTGGALVIAGGVSYSPRMTLRWVGGAGQTVDERGTSAVKAVKTAAQSIPNSTVTAITFPQTDEYDTDGMHDPAVNNTRITIKTPGLYELTADASWGTGTTGRRQLHFLKNGTTVIRSVQDQAQNEAAAWHGNLIVAHALLAAGDYVEVMCFHTQGAALNVDQASFDATLVTTGKTVTPGARLEKTVAQSIPSAVSTAISWDAAGERADNDLMWDVGQPTRLVCRTAGWYIVAAGLSWAANSGSFREIAIQKTLAGGGATTVASERSIPVTTAGYSHPLSIPALVELAVGDYIEVMARQEIGSGLNVNASPGSYLASVKIGAPAGPSSGIDIVEGWHTVGAAGEPAFTNGGVAIRPIRFKKDRGRTTIQAGSYIQSPNANVALFTLPVGYRPSYTVMTQGYDNTGALIKLTVTDTGEVQIGTAKPTGWVDLGNLSFSND